MVNLGAFIIRIGLGVSYTITVTVKLGVLEDGEATSKERPL